MVQLPENIDENTKAFKEGYKNIAEIGRNRIVKLGEAIKENGTNDVDVGFKYLQLSSSNIQAWNPDHTDLEDSLLSHQEHLIEGRSEQDVLYELLLKRGIDLAVTNKKPKGLR